MDSEQLEKEPFLPTQDVRSERKPVEPAAEPGGRKWWRFPTAQVVLHCCLIAIYTIAALLLVRNHTRSCERPCECLYSKSRASFNVVQRLLTV